MGFSILGTFCPWDFCPGTQDPIGLVTWFLKKNHEKRRHMDACNRRVSETKNIFVTLIRVRNFVDSNFYSIYSYFNNLKLL